MRDNSLNKGRTTSHKTQLKPIEKEYMFGFLFSLRVIKGLSKID
jgi:hypothetical protein